MVFEFKLPDIGEGIVEGEIVRWLVGDNEVVQEDQPIVEVMTDKATVEIPSPRAGKIIKRFGAEGDVIKVGSTLVVIESDEDEVKKRKEAEAPDQPAAPPVLKGSPAQASPVKNTEQILATPAVRKLARELGIDLKTVKGTGPGGRITEEDLKRPSAKGRGSATPARVLAYRGLRKKIGDHMVESKRTAPHFTYVEEVDMTELIGLRDQWVAAPPEPGLRITFLPFIMKAVAEGLKKFSIVNSSLDEARGVIELKQTYHIGFAVATDEGLMVPVVHDVDKKGIATLSREIADLSDAARAGKIKLEDLKNGSFTITSLGALGGFLATPIINFPEVAILGVHKIAKRPMVKDNQIVARDIMMLSLSLDHRVVDGIVGAQFLQEVIRLIENPSLLKINS